VKKCRGGAKEKEVNICNSKRGQESGRAGFLNSAKTTEKSCEDYLVNPLVTDVTIPLQWRETSTTEN